MLISHDMVKQAKDRVSKLLRGELREMGQGALVNLYFQSEGVQVIFR